MPKEINDIPRIDVLRDNRTKFIVDNYSDVLKSIVDSSIKGESSINVSKDTFKSSKEAKTFRLVLTERGYFAGIDFDGSLMVSW